MWVLIELYSVFYFMVLTDGVQQTLYIYDCAAPAHFYYLREDTKGQHYRSIPIPY
jgi:hypothetical protein